MQRLVSICALVVTLSACKSPGESGVSGTEGALSQGEEQPAAQGVSCGKNVCAAGMECCNASCGTCVSPGSMCTQQICESGGAATEPTPPVSPAAPPAEEGGMTCANVRCAGGTHCEMVQVQCIRAPCNPVPECKPEAAPGAGASPSGPGAGVGVSCGKHACATDEVCCNSSCGICTKPGQGCVKMLCPDGERPGAPH